MKVLITGGAGFIGCNIARRHILNGDEVYVLDNLSRRGTPGNIEWLKTVGRFTFIKKDIRDYSALKSIFQGRKFDVVYHMAAQVAVTTSIKNPREDFEINILGTLNLLEAMRLSRSRAFLIFASTNKVYGALEDIKLTEGKTRYDFKGEISGINESKLLDFHSPYGCSKGAADQYINDYSRIYGLKTVVFRQSCIYGKRQLGVEDQGWVAYFIIQTVFGKPVTIYGDGKQVRDILYVEDLIDAYEIAYKKQNVSSGNIYNIGGGENNKISLLEFIRLLEKKLNTRIRFSFDDWRSGDQKIYVSDSTKLDKELAWKPSTDINSGLEILIDWVGSNRDLFKSI